MQGVVSHQPAGSTDEIRAHLGKILKSPQFRASKRCQGMLTFLIEKTLEGRQDVLKERVIGTEVFDRASDYNPGEDPIVRVTAAEVRKRLAQFYQENPDHAAHALCFRIASGGYIPEFYTATLAEPETPPAAKPRKLPKWAWIGPLFALVLVILAAVSWTFFRAQDPVSRFWNPAFHSRRAPLIVMERYGAGDLIRRLNSELRLSKQSNATSVVVGDISDTFGQATMLGNVHSLRDIDRVFAARGLTPELRVGAEVSTSDLAERPVILLGYFNNPWAKDLNTGNLPFTFFTAHESAGFVHGIRDNLHPGKSWTLTSDREWFTTAPVSYAVVTRLLQKEPARFMIFISGITHSGTQAASDFIAGQAYLTELERQAPQGWENKNLQFVLETHIVNQTPTPPKILAVHSW